MKLPLLIAVTALALSACAGPRLAETPVAVQIMPNDCANRVAIENWLTAQAAISRNAFENAQVYEQTIAQIRHRLWSMRYNCQPV